VNFSPGPVDRMPGIPAAGVGRKDMRLGKKLAINLNLSSKRHGNV
jgi:hypothetical protein